MHISNSEIAYHYYLTLPWRYNQYKHSVILALCVVIAVVVGEEEEEEEDQGEDYWVINIHQRVLRDDACSQTR